jgi:hypothetical protein
LSLDLGAHRLESGLHPVPVLEEEVAAVATTAAQGSRRSVPGIRPFSGTITAVAAWMLHGDIRFRYRRETNRFR